MRIIKYFHSNNYLGWMLYFNNDSIWPHRLIKYSEFGNEESDHNEVLYNFILNDNILKEYYKNGDKCIVYEIKNNVVINEMIPK